MTITRDGTLLTSDLIERHTAVGYRSDTTLVDLFRRGARDVRMTSPVRRPI